MTSIQGIPKTSSKAHSLRRCIGTSTMPSDSTYLRCLMKQYAQHGLKWVQQKNSNSFLNMWKRCRWGLPTVVMWSWSSNENKRRCKIYDGRIMAWRGKENIREYCQAYRIGKSQMGMWRLMAERGVFPVNSASISARLVKHPLRFMGKSSMISLKG